MGSPALTSRGFIEQDFEKVRASFCMCNPVADLENDYRVIRLAGQLDDML